MAVWQIVCFFLVSLVAVSRQFPAVPEDEEDMINFMAKAKLAGMFGGDQLDLDAYRQAQNQMEEEEDNWDGRLWPVEDWPAQDLSLGQVGGVDVDKNGQVHVFHRAGRTWTEKSFDANNTFLEKDKGAISEPTLLTLKSKDGEVITKAGQNRFYMPHGLTIDPEGNTWTTDVALHQVFKFAPGQEEPMLTLGKAFEPAVDNHDEERFCKPTDVAVSSQGDVFIADGYCNSRIVKLDSEGHYVDRFGDDEFYTPHSLALAEELDVLCVADRDNKRILCFGAGLQEPDMFGQPVKEYNGNYLGRVFAISYSKTDGLLYAVSGPTDGEHVPSGFTFDLTYDSPDPVAAWYPDAKGFSQPHDLAVSPDGDSVYVGEIGPDKLWKFTKA